MCGVLSNEERVEKNNSLLGVKKYIPFATAYSFLICGIYLCVYWNKFNINIFEYASPVDIFMLALPGLAGGISLLLFVAWVGTQLSDMGKSTDRTAKIGKKLRVFCVLLVLGFWAAMIYSLSSVIGGFFRWILLTLIFGTNIAVVLDKNVFFAAIKNSKVRYALVFFIVSMPFISLEAGEIHSNSIILGRSYQYTEYTQQAEKAQKTDQKLRYIGIIGEHIFFYESEGAGTVVTTMNHLGILKLHKYEKNNS